jgi:hypothetical protein
MKTFYLHAGEPKTGSTALQHYCFKNRDKLCENNLYYVNTGRFPDPVNHWGLFPIKNERWIDLTKEINECDSENIMCSCECMHLSMLKNTNYEDEFKKISSYLPDCQIKFITYIRRIDDFSRSDYNQHFKLVQFLLSRNNIASINDIDNVFEYAYNKMFLEYNSWVNNSTRYYLFQLTEFIDKSAKYFGKENHILKIYDRKLLKNNNIIDDFFDTIGIDISDIPQDGLFTNEKIPDASLPLYQTLYDSGIPWESESIRAIQKKIFRLYSLPQGSDAGKFVNQTEINSLIERMDSLCPGYKDLFADRKCDFSFPEIDFDPKDRLLFDLLFSMYAQQHDLHAQQRGLRESLSCLESEMHDLHAQRRGWRESLSRLESEMHSPSFKNGIVSAIADNESYAASLKNAIISALYPNLFQRLVLQMFRLFYRLTRKREVYHHFRHRNVDFISRPDLYPSKILRQILRIFGPIPPIRR